MYNIEDLKKRYSRISASALGYFEVDPKYFKNYIDKLLDEDTPKYMELGVQLHMYLLEPEEFQKNYTYLDVTKPKGAIQSQFCEIIANSKIDDLEESIVNAYKLSYVIKTKNEDKIKEDALELYNKLIDYITYLQKRKEFKDVLPKSTFNYLTEAKYQAENHVAVKEMLFETDSIIDTGDVFTANELFVLWEHPTIMYKGTKLVLKSFIDRLVIDHTNKIIKLIDLKTSSNLHDLRTSYDSYKYYRQMAFYWSAIEYYFKHQFADKDIKNYSRETFIIGIQTPNFQKDYPIRCKVFPLQQEDLDKGHNEVEELLDDIKWHMDENKWAHSRSYYENNGLEKTL